MANATFSSAMIVQRTDVSTAAWAKPESTEGMMLQQRNGLSRASTKHATVVSLFRINVRLSGRHKCHSVMPT